MDTSGLNAFDHDTRVGVERLLRPKPKPGRRRVVEESESTIAARAWLEHKAAGGTTTQRAWAAMHGVKEHTMSATICLLRHPGKREAKNEKLRRLRRTPPAL